MIEYYKKYLIRCLNCCLNKQDAPAPEEEVEWDKLYRLAKLNAVDNNVYYALRNADFVPEEIFSKLEESFDFVLKKQEAENKELDIVLALFREKMVPYMLMKGIITRKLYPEQFMRSSADIDIYYNEIQTGTVREILFDRGYNITFTGIYDDIYKNLPYLDIEMHKLLLSPITKIGKNFKYRPFLNGITIDGLEYTMADDDFYIYHFCHLAQHFYDSGAGIKFFMDIKILRDILNLDMEYVYGKLKKFHLIKFHDECVKLVDYWFNGGEPDEVCEIFEQFVLSFTAYGAGAVFDYNRTESGKRNRYISAVFPSAERLSYRYPDVRNKKYKVPYYWVKRLYDYRGTYKQRLDDVSKHSNTDFKSIKEFYTKIGL